MSLAARALLLAVRVYQAFFSALMPSACKFYPSCSHYAAEALRIHGARRGSWLAVRRVSRCHPFTKGGVDLVPDAAEFPRKHGSAANATLPSRTGFCPLRLNFRSRSQTRQAEARPTKASSEVHS